MVNDSLMIFSHRKAGCLFNKNSTNGSQNIALIILFLNRETGQFKGWQIYFF
jgi:hypothetical protein